METLSPDWLKARPESGLDWRIVLQIVRERLHRGSSRLRNPPDNSTASERSHPGDHPTTLPLLSEATRETTEGQMDGFFSQLPFICCLPEVASVRDGLKICPWVVFREEGTT